MLNDFSQIQSLPEEDGDLIKATVTISSVSHCLRELIENSLDAGSKIISIKINNCGLESIVVSDDGCGISLSDLNLICFEGATSKDIKLISYKDNSKILVSSIDCDIESNPMLKLNSDEHFKSTKAKCFSNFSGGRGRALGAIANISYLTIESSCNNSGSGFRLTFAQSGERTISSISRLKGTSISVQSLFYAYPVRRHHLLQRRVDELRDIEEVITAFALSTKCTINVSIDGKMITQVHSSNFVHRIKSVLGSEVSSHLIHGKVDLTDWFHDTYLEFYTTPLDGNVNGRIYLSINGRPTVNMNIIRGIRNEYRMCNGNKWPVVCLMISTTARESYEFTPDSPLICTEFVKEDLLRSIICTALHKSWIDDLPSSSFASHSSSSFPLSFPSAALISLTSCRVGESDNNPKKGKNNKQPQTSRLKPTRPNCLTNNVVHSSLTTDKIIERCRRAKTDNKEGFGQRNTIIKQSSFSQMEVIGQWNKAFIITRLGADIFAIDQHAACEATNYEKLKNSSKIDKDNQSTTKQKFLAPVILNVPQEDIENARTYVDKCRSLGFEYEIINTNSEGNQEFNQIESDTFDQTQYQNLSQKEVEANYFSQSQPKYALLVKAIPSNKSTATGLHDLQEMLMLMRDAPQLDFPQTQNSKRKMMFRACHSSVRVGDTLSVPMMKKILKEMATSEYPWNCPHGRPTWCCIEALETG